MKRQRIGKLKWSDVFVWPGLIGVCLACFALLVLVYYYGEMPDDVRRGYIVFLIAGLLLSLLKMKTILEYDGELLYVVSIRFFMRYVSDQIRVKDIKEMKFVPDLWNRRASLEFFRHKFLSLPKEERTFWRFYTLNLQIVLHFLLMDKAYFSENIDVQEGYTAFKVCIIYESRKKYDTKKVVFEVKRDDEVYKFLCRLRDDLEQKG